MTNHAEVDIRDGQLYSRQFDDIYFSQEDGLAESHYVFLEGNKLPARWQNQSHFCITETGFGSGLNFLVTAQAWLEDPHRSTSLDYYSIEGYPLSADQLRKIHAQWGKYQPISAALLEQYPIITNGCHTLVFEGGEIQLHLIFEDIQYALKHYPIKPDCWYLDGFSPAKNPQMWDKNILKKIGELSSIDTRLATFTAAGEVRRNLIEAGFEIHKRKGFGRKREMICARKIHTRASQNLFKHAPWFATTDERSNIQHVSVIGAGIAGAQIAHHLAQQGIEVLVIESEKHIATGASGNLAGVFSPRITAEKSAGEAFYITAFLYQLKQLSRLKNEGHDIQFTPHGLLQLVHNKTAQNRFEKLAARKDLPAELVTIISAKKASKILGETIKHPAMFMQNAGSLSPKSLCKALLSNPRITLRCATQVEHISHNDGKPNLILSDGETLSSDAVVIANGYQATNFADTLPITPTRGQSSSATLATGHNLAHALGHKGYVVNVPADKHRIIFGASYLRDDSDSALKEAETLSNLSELRKHMPQLAKSLTDISDSHAGIRATTPDRWPIVGPLPDVHFYREQYADLSQGKQHKAYPAAQYCDAIYVLSGLGSRGLTSAAYCANLLSHMLLGKTPPAPVHMLRSLHPARFLVRSLKRGLSEN